MLHKMLVRVAKTLGMYRDPRPHVRATPVEGSLSEEVHQRLRASGALLDAVESRLDMQERQLKRMAAEADNRTQR